MSITKRVVSLYMLVAFIFVVCGPLLVNAQATHVPTASPEGSTVSNAPTLSPTLDPVIIYKSMSLVTIILVGVMVGMFCIMLFACYLYCSSSSKPTPPQQGYARV